MSTKDAHRLNMSDKRRRAVLELQAKRLEIAHEVADATGWERSQVELLLRQARWDAEKVKAKIERCSGGFTVAEADMVGSYADRRQQATAFLMDALACNRTEASKLLAGAGGRVEKVIAELIKKHKALKRRRLKYAEEDAAAAAARLSMSGTEPTADEAADIDIPADPADVELVGSLAEIDDPSDWPIDITEEHTGEGDVVGAIVGCDTVVIPILEQGDASNVAIVCGAGSSSLACVSADEDDEDTMQAILAVDANEIQCLAKVFDLDIASARRHYETAVPARNGTCFAAAVNSIVAEYLAEIMVCVDRRASRKLHKLKLSVMKHMLNWNACRGQYFPFTPGRDPDPVGDAIASCFEMADNREILPCDKKGCCVMKSATGQSSGGKAKAVCDVVPSVVPSGGKAKVVYTGKAKA